jgi:head-tail adaptor
MRPTEWVKIQRWQPGNDFDGRDGKWETVESLPAVIKSARGQEPVIAGVQVQALHDVEVTVRFQDWLTTEHRLIGPDGNVLNISGITVLDNGRAWWMKLACVEVE